MTKELRKALADYRKWHATLVRAVAASKKATR